MNHSYTTDQSWWVMRMRINSSTGNNNAHMNKARHGRSQNLHLEEAEAGPLRIDRLHSNDFDFFVLKVKDHDDYLWSRARANCKCNMSLTTQSKNLQVTPSIDQHSSRSFQFSFHSPVDYGHPSPSPSSTIVHYQTTMSTANSATTTNAVNLDTIFVVQWHHTTP
mmetsp:Transcript_711/g.1099  ORF Transcript_711/g.1099 Transcript_711/m.1099 type:complete len:165 (-) Transcript_711:298-792(-)